MSEDLEVTRTAALSAAIRVFFWLVDEKRNGYRIVAVDKQGKGAEVLLTGIDSLDGAEPTGRLPIFESE